MEIVMADVFVKFIILLFLINAPPDAGSHMVNALAFVMILPLSSEI